MLQPTRPIRPGPGVPADAHGAAAHHGHHVPFLVWVPPMQAQRELVSGRAGRDRKRSGWCMTEWLGLGSDIT
ncbi:hypothetical protein CEP53_009117 [Fusarium sp. AF-6]|nr:hypothetical protein CEP53_009117 [Fusarium sp. AF-6]